MKKEDETSLLKNKNNSLPHKSPASKGPRVKNISKKQKNV